MTFYLGQGYIWHTLSWNEYSANLSKEVIFMIYAGIDVSKYKHDCFVLDSSGEVLEDVFSFDNSNEGFNLFLSNLKKHTHSLSDEKIRIGLEATGHYSSCLEEFLYGIGLTPVILNPLSTNMYRKASTLRKTKTDKSDAKLITSMLIAESTSPTTRKSYHIRELKSLSRHRFRLIGYQSKLKISIRRILDMVFPELSASVWSIHQKSSYQLLLAFPNPGSIASCHLTKLTHLLSESSHGRYGRDKALQIRNMAKTSIGLNSPSLAFELQQTILLVQSLQDQILVLDRKIKDAVTSLDSPLMSVPGISYKLAATILTEIADINRFGDPAKLLAFAGLEPSMHQSGRYTAGNTPMVKRGSTYLRWALLNAARLVVMRDPTFSDYYHRKRSEGKHHYVALSHTARKLVRVIFHMLKTGCNFIPQS